MKKETALRLSENRCVYCYEVLTLATVTVDHVLPRSRFKGVPFNGRAACRKCNNIKSAYTVEELWKHLWRLFIPFMIGRLFRKL